MGNCSGPAVNKDDLQKSKEIDDQLRKEKKTIDHEVKLLLLGAGESGKKYDCQTDENYLSDWIY